MHNPQAKAGGLLRRLQVTQRDWNGFDVDQLGKLN
jgi:hypothetical protein